MVFRFDRNVEFALGVVVPFVFYGIISAVFLLLVLPLALYEQFTATAANSFSALQVEFFVGLTVASFVILGSLSCLMVTLERGVEYFRRRTLAKFVVIVGILAGCVLAAAILALAVSTSLPFPIIYLLSPGFSVFLGVRTIFELLRV
jgi:hypothetical protein